MVCGLTHLYMSKITHLTDKKMSKTILQKVTIKLVNLSNTKAKETPNKSDKTATETDSIQQEELAKSKPKSERPPKLRIGNDGRKASQGVGAGG